MTVIADPFPDVELIACDWLRGLPDIAAIVGSRVSTELPAVEAWPRLHVARIGGTPTVSRRLDAASLQVSAFGDPSDPERRPATSRLARLARVSLHAMPGYSHAEGWVTGVDDDLPLRWLPDDSRVPTIPRYVFGVTVYAHP